MQIGNYGAMMHGFADNEGATGWPMQLPAVGERKALAFQRDLNKQVHDLGLTVVGHFRLVKVMGNWQEQTGFVDYYNNRWPEDLLGPKPNDDLRELLQRHADGTPIQLGRSGRSQLALCLSSPYARQMFKQMLKLTIEQGVDGVVTNYNYRFACACPYCQKAFKSWLREHLTPAQIKAKLGIDNLDEYTFPEIPVHIAGYPDPAKATELDWLAMRWGAEHFKKMFDEIFIDYGRSLDQDLIVATWNHLSHVSPKEERTFLPLSLWGKGEDYFWYSGGAAFVGKNHDLSKGKAGDAWLSCLYVRALSGGKPFVIGKYDRTRMAVSMAEGYATGGMGMGRYMRFEDPVGFEVLARYTNFMHKHRELYDGAKPWSDVALVLPRQSVLNRQPQAQRAFGELGQALLEKQALLDVIVDQRLTTASLAQYPAIILIDAHALSDAQLATLRNYVANGGMLLIRGDVATMDEHGQPRQHSVDIPGSITITDEDAKNLSTTADLIAKRLHDRDASVIASPWTVRAAAYAQPHRLMLHLVNYDRADDAPTNNRTGPETERPEAVEDIKVDLRLPAGQHATAVTLHSPDRHESMEIPFESSAGRVRFTVPRILVYDVLTIETSNESR